MNKDKKLPQPNLNRILDIDILRGFALFGILLVNILGFNASFFDFGGFYKSLPDAFQQSFYTTYINLTADKFIFLFSFLFGYGIFMQYDKFQQNILTFSRFLARRMFVLSIFGLLHILLLWAGDILFLYSLAGTFILLFIRIKTKNLIAFALFFYFFISFWFVANIWIVLPDALSSTCRECLDKARIIYSQGNYAEALKLRLYEYYSFRNINAIYYLSKVIGIILFGIIAGRLNLYQRFTKNRKHAAIIFVIILISSVILYVYHEQWINFDHAYAMALYMFLYELMNFLISCSYLLLILLLLTLHPIFIFLRPLAFMGRMSLTNYLMQSIILSLLFYGWGFGFFGHLKVTDLVIIAIVVYAYQLIYTTIWFRYYRQGPLEKLWRKLSYRRKF